MGVNYVYLWWVLVVDIYVACVYSWIDVYVCCWIGYGCLMSI